MAVAGRGRRASPTPAANTTGTKQNTPYLP